MDVSGFSAHANETQTDFFFSELAKIANKATLIDDDETETDNKNDDDEEEYGYTYVARTYMDAPDVDGYLFIMNVPYDLMSGQFVDVLITGSNDYDLIGELMEGNEDENEFTE